MYVFLVLVSSRPHCFRKSSTEHKAVIHLPAFILLSGLVRFISILNQSVLIYLRKNMMLIGIFFHDSFGSFSAKKVAYNEYFGKA